MTETPSGKDSVLLRRQARRARLLREARAAAELQDAAPDWGENEEPSVVTIKGPAAEDFVSRLRKDSPVPESGPESIRVKAEKLLAKRYGKTVAGLVMTVIGLVFAAVLQALAR